MNRRPTYFESILELLKDNGYTIKDHKDGGIWIEEPIYLEWASVVYKNNGKFKANIMDFSSNNDYDMFKEYCDEVTNVKNILASIEELNPELV